MSEGPRHHPCRPSAKPHPPRGQRASASRHTPVALPHQGGTGCCVRATGASPSAAGPWDAGRWGAAELSGGPRSSFSPRCPARAGWSKPRVLGSCKLVAMRTLSPRSLLAKNRVPWRWFAAAVACSAVLTASTADVLLRALPGPAAAARRVRDPAALAPPRCACARGSCPRFCSSRSGCRRVPAQRNPRAERFASFLVREPTAGAKVPASGGLNDRIGLRSQPGDRPSKITGSTALVASGSPGLGPAAAPCAARRGRLMSPGPVVNSSHALSYAQG